MSEGFCEVDFDSMSDDADPCSFVDRTSVKARKSHVCTECGGTIAPGETYQRIASVFEGEFRADKICEPCQEAAGEFHFYIIGGLLWQSFEEQWDEGAHIQACIQRLETARAKEHMRQQWLKWQEKRRAEQIARTARLAAIREQQKS